MSAVNLSGKGPDATPGSRHLLRIFLIWLTGSVILELVIGLGLAPHLSPGNMTNTAQSQQWDIEVLLWLAAPVLVLVYTWFGYNLIVFRHRGGPITDGAWWPRDKTWIQVAWVLSTASVVLFCFGFGTYELVGARYGAGGGEGPSAIWAPPVKLASAWKPASNPTELQVQVIGQQWRWTFRYPQFGGMETTRLVIPDHTWVRFDVTSLDVIHSFGAFQLGVKADANPGVDNIAFTKAQQLGNFAIRCDELCGIWHGAMVSTGTVMSQSAFYSWAQHQQTALAATTAQLPKFALTYEPSFEGAGGQLYQGRVYPNPHPNSTN